MCSAQPTTLGKLKINTHCEVPTDKIPGYVKSIPINHIYILFPRELNMCGFKFPLQRLPPDLI
jgi:hypothetical protein